jgi:hypothetical protein
MGGVAIGVSLPSHAYKALRVFRKKFFSLAQSSHQLSTTHFLSLLVLPKFTIVKSLFASYEKNVLSLGVGGDVA